MNVRRLLLALAMMAGLALPSIAQERNVQVTPSPIVFPCTVVGETSFVVFRLTNHGTRDEDIREYDLHFLRSGAPFRVKNIEPLDLELAPGESRIDTLFFTPTQPSHLGEWTGELEVRMSGSNRPRIPIMARATPPPHLVLQDTIRWSTLPGNSAVQCVQLRNESCRPITISRIVFSDPAYTLKSYAPLPDPIGGADSVKELCVEFAPTTSTPALARARVESPDGRFREVFLLWDRPSGDIEALPPAVRFDTTLLNTTSRDTIVQIINRGTAGTQITAWRLTGPDAADFLVTPPAIPAPLPPNSSATADFTVAFAPKRIGQKMAQIELDIQGEPRPVVVPLGGVGSIGRVHVDPQVIDMGRVFIGSRAVANDTIVIHNRGSQPIGIVSVTLRGPDDRQFAIPDATSTTIAPGDSARYTVEFAPDARRQFEATAVIRLSTGPELLVRLHGVGIPPPRVSVTPQIIDFGGVEVGAELTFTDTITVRAMGPGPPLRVDSIVIHDADSIRFSIPDAAAATIPPPPGGLRYSARFAPDSARKFAAEATIYLSNGDTEVVVLSGRGLVRGGIEVRPTVIDFNRVEVGRSLLLADTIHLVNVGIAPAQITGITVEGADRARFEVTDPTLATLPPGNGEERYSVRFIPDGERAYSARVHLTFANGEATDVELRGIGFRVQEPDPRRFTITLDSAIADVNKRFLVTVRISPALTPADSVTEFRVRLRIDHNALYVHGIAGASPERDSVIYRALDTVELVRRPGIVITGDTLAQITLEGLVTGRPVNQIDVVDASIMGRDTGSAGGGGIVELIGCDIGRGGVTFSRPVTVHRTYPVPVRDKVTIRYTSPAGSQPVLRILDLTGRPLRHDSLPEGTGAEQEISVGVGELGPGYYLVQLRYGAGISTVPVVVE